MLYTDGMNKTKSGFTLIELLIVLVVIGILAGISLITYRGTQGRTRDAERKGDIANIVKALELYYSDNGRYPITSGTASSINSYWYTSGDSSWNTFKTDLSGRIDTLAVDPINSPGNPLTAGNYGYGYFTGFYCGKPAGQWYILIYRMEVLSKEKLTDGDCSTNSVGDSYYDAGNSYYRMVR